MVDLTQRDTDVILRGKYFITTRPYGKSKELGHLLNMHGAKLMELPMIALSEVECDEEANLLFADYTKYTHIAFTSAYGFAFFYKKVSQHQQFKDILDKLKIVSIGYKTSELIRSYGLTIDFDAQAKTGSEFAERFLPYLSGKNAKVIWATGSLSPNKLTQRVGEVAQITRVNLYENTLPEKIDEELLKKINQGDYDMIVLASPSAFQNLYPLVDTAKLKVVCIGQVTAAAVKRQGVTPLAIASEPTPQGIADAIIQYYQNNL